jgi:hypothetical protein
VWPCLSLTAVEFVGSLSFHESKVLKHGHCQGTTSLIGADHGDDGIYIYGLVSTFIGRYRLIITDRHRLAIDMPSSVANDSPSSAIIDSYPLSLGPASATTRGFSLTIGTMNFYINDAGISRLLHAVEIATSAVDSALPLLAIIQQTHAVNFVSSSPAAHPGAHQAPESSSPSVGCNILHGPPPSPTTTYCIDCDG